MPRLRAVRARVDRVGAGGQVVEPERAVALDARVEGLAAQRALRRDGVLRAQPTAVDRLACGVDHATGDDDGGRELEAQARDPLAAPHVRLAVDDGREALRLAFIQHKQMATGLKGVRQQRSISEAFSQQGSGQTLVDMMKLDMVVGSGGVLSHSPRRIQAGLMMVDAFEPEGFTELTVDSIFMMPQLGVLSTVKQHADLVLGLYREEMYNPGGGVEGATELIVAKNRNGPTGFIDLYFHHQWMRFEDMLDPE